MMWQSKRDSLGHCTSVDENASQVLAPRRPKVASTGKLSIEQRAR
jgi:hypothetical protein